MRAYPRGSANAHAELHVYNRDGYVCIYISGYVHGAGRNGVKSY
jgi:hypothetical protein